MGYVWDASEITCTESHLQMTQLFHAQSILAQVVGKIGYRALPDLVNQSRCR